MDLMQSFMWMSVHLSGSAEIESHSEAVVDLAARLLHFAAMSVHGIEPNGESGVDVRVCMTAQCVVTVTAHRVLFAVDHFVCHAAS